MIEFAMSEFSYSETAALRRIKASRLLKEIPQLEKKIVNGSITLSNIDKAVGFFKREEIKDTAKKLQILSKLENLSTRECEKALFELAPTVPLPKESIRPVSAEYTQLKVNICETTYKKLHEARSLIGKASINDEFFNQLAEHAIRDIRFKKFKTRETPQDPDSRYLTNQTKRMVYEKSSGICENCGSLFLLEYDHIEAFSKGGKTVPENLRLLCFHCNQRAWFKICNPGLS